ncbi:MAG: hypothetical protein WD136_02595 [Cyanobium sp.]
MKTTIDLPDTLVRQARQRALHEGRPFKQLIADFIRQGLSEVVAKSSLRPGSSLELTADGLPCFRRDPAVAPQIPSLQQLLELEQSTLAEEDQQRAGFPG